MEREEQLFFNDERTINGECITVDEAFSKYVDDVSVLDRYPILGIEYKNNNGVLVKKSRRELLDSYIDYEKGLLVFNGSSNNMVDMYDCLLRKNNNKTK